MLEIRRSMRFHPSIHTSIHSSIYISIHPSIYLSINLSICRFRWFSYLNIYLSIYLSNYLSICATFSRLFRSLKHLSSCNTADWVASTPFSIIWDLILSYLFLQHCILSDLIYENINSVLRISSGTWALSEPVGGISAISQLLLITTIHKRKIYTYSMTQ